MWLRWRGLLRMQLVLDLLLITAVGPALVTGGALSSVRCLENTPPFTGWRWHATTTQQPTQSDLVRQIMPWMAETRRHVLAGRLPLISDRIGGGLPLLANGQTGTWAPLNLPVWVVGPERGTTVMALWKIELAGLGAFLFLRRRWRLSRAAAATGSAAFAGSAYLMAWLIVPMGWVIALLPWIWWLMEWPLRGRASVARVLCTGLLVGWLAGSGLNPETSAIVIGSAVLGGVVGHPRRWWRITAVVGVAIVLALALAWPTVGYILASSRAEVMAGDNPNFVRPSGTIRLQAVQQLLVPMALGHPGRGDWSGGYPYAAAAVGVGGLALGLVAVGRARRRHRRLLWASLASLATAAVLGYRMPPLDTVLVRIPPLDHMTLPRFVVLVPWALALCAALAAEGAFRGRLRSPWWRAAAIAGVAAVAGTGVVRGLVPVDAALAAVTVVATTVASWLLRRPGWLAPAVAAELCLYAVAINPVAAAADMLPTPPLVDRLVELRSERDGRLIGRDGALPPNLACRYGLRDLRAFDPLRPEPFVRLMGLLGDPEPILGSRLRSAPPALCGSWSVRYLVTPPGARAPGWERVWSDATGVIWTNPRWLPEIRTVGRARAVDEDSGWRLLASGELDFATEAVVPQDSPEVGAARAELVATEAADDRVRAVVRCDGPCLLVVARPWAPGWRAWIDGAPASLVRANLAGLGAVAPAGEHEVELRYNPWMW